MFPFGGFGGPDIFGYEFGGYDKDFIDLESVVHEAGDGCEGGDGFAETHFDENAGGWVSEDVVDDVVLVVVKVLFGHFGLGISDCGCGRRRSFGGHSDLTLNPSHTSSALRAPSP